MTTSLEVTGTANDVPDEDMNVMSPAPEPAWTFLSKVRVTLVNDATFSAPLDGLRVVIKGAA